MDSLTAEQALKYLNFLKKQNNKNNELHSFSYDFNEKNELNS